MGITTASLKANRAANEKRFWDDRARRWRDEETERLHAEAVDPAPRRRKPKWAVDHLYEQGKLTAAQHEAAHRTAEVLARAQRPPKLSASSLVAVHPGWDQTFATEMARAARAWDGAQSRQIARAAVSWVEAAPRTTKGRMRLLGRLFAFPHPSWKMILNGSGQRAGQYGYVDRISALLDVLAAFWDTQDRNYGPAP